MKGLNIAVINLFFACTGIGILANKGCKLDFLYRGAKKIQHYHLMK